VPIVVGLELADQVRPGAVGQVCGLVSAVASSDWDAGPGFGGDVDGPTVAVADGMQSLGGGSQEVVGVVGPAGVTAFRAEEQVAGPRPVVAFAGRVIAVVRARACVPAVFHGPSHEVGQKRRQVQDPEGAVLGGGLADHAAEFAQLPVHGVGRDARLGSLERRVLPGPSFDGGEFAPAHTSPSGEHVHDEVDVPAGQQCASLSQAQGLEWGDDVRRRLLHRAGRRPAFRAHSAAAALAPLGRVPLDLAGVHSVAEDRDQQRTCRGGD
jgi:hypothetical protein